MRTSHRPVLSEFKKTHGREHPIAGSDCGFAQGPFVQRVHPALMWAKLGSLVEGAALASREL
jgi:5-methyltetrahydropteroyltriglutamate--homocysteine methyltransferase